MLPIFTTIKAMKTAHSVEQATDAQLRQLTRPWAFSAEYKGMVQSQLPLLTTERSNLINLLKSHHINQFVQP